ncbi:ABC transporter ATP-binding protein [Rhodoferax koreense]|uniref:ABC transporter ATP-binding protein n=1 Tax=Rhodoferax koreensis TaxID=1842727 RepID=A0A1P8JZD5_9BURK|nr:ABC transporter ATP-binding protein [Rhodoferax koreense]APW39061.1 ABC transporter ATP-binding protein [Rhodoferax koreense]
MLTLEHVTAGYGNSQVLFGMQLQARDGEVVSMVGRNGMGKTTTVRTLMGMLPCRAGQIAVGGTPLNRLPPHVISRLGVGLVPEGRRVFGSLNVQENLVATARAVQGEGQARGHWSLGRVFALFPRLEERRRQSARTLSGGEQQMLAIGRALMTNPRLLVLDEATEGLAPLIRREIWQCLQTLKGEGLTILVVDKNLAEMAALVDRHHIVEKGRVVWTGSPAELAVQPELAQRYLGL